MFNEKITKKKKVFTRDEEEGVSWKAEMKRIFPLMVDVSLPRTFLSLFTLRFKASKDFA